MQDCWLQSRLLQVAGVYEFKFLRGDLCCPSFLGIRCQMALEWSRVCCHTIVSLALGKAKLSLVSP